MSKEFTCVGLMSGTSADGVDASVINSDGNDKYNVIKNKFFKRQKNVLSECLKIQYDMYIEKTSKR